LQIIGKNKQVILTIDILTKVRIQFLLYPKRIHNLNGQKHTQNISRVLYKALKFKVFQNYNTLNINNKTLSIFTIVAVFAMGLAVYSHQNAAATIISSAQDAPRDAILDAQSALKSLESTSQNKEVRDAIAEGQEGLSNATSALDNATSALNNLPGESSISPLDQGAGSLGNQNTDPVGQSSDLLDQGTNSLGNSTSQPTNFQ
jgi:hypothetical protein